jgi:uncharacterized protein (DUF1697 family)
MADLRAALIDLGCDRPQSLLQSGNVVFDAVASRPAGLETTIAAELARRLRLNTAVFVRTAAEWRDLIAVNPCPEAAKRDASRLLLMVLRDAPSAAEVASLRKAVKGREQVHVVGRQAYLVYPDGIGRSRLTNALLERHLGSPGTARNWNTVLKLAALLG